MVKNNDLVPGRWQGILCCNKVNIGEENKKQKEWSHTGINAARQKKLSYSNRMFFITQVKEYKWIGRKGTGLIFYLYQQYLFFILPEQPVNVFFGKKFMLFSPAHPGDVELYKTIHIFHRSKRGKHFAYRATSKTEIIAYPARTVKGKTFGSPVLFNKIVWHLLKFMFVHDGEWLNNQRVISNAVRIHAPGTCFKHFISNLRISTG